MKRRSVLGRRPRTRTEAMSIALDRWFSRFYLKIRTAAARPR